MVETEDGPVPLNSGDSNSLTGLVHLILEV